VAQPNRAASSRAAVGRKSPRLKPGVRREQILEIATDYFGRDGYEDTKWADVASAVGIGSTALYHYFESKQHCLFEIMVDALTESRRRFDDITAENEDWTDALVALLVSGFELSEHEILRNRVLIAEQGLLGVQRALPREEAARSGARSRARDLEFVWGTFFARGMQQGLLVESDPRLLTRAVLGLYNSVWHWYRPGGTPALSDVGRFFVGRQLAILGCPTDLADIRFTTNEA
jgi:AcrR family transcriptional regulator